MGFFLCVKTMLSLSDYFFARFKCSNIICRISFLVLVLRRIFVLDRFGYYI